MDKILRIQSEIGVLSKTETNPFFKSKYMDINGLLAQLLPLLEKHKLTVIQPLSYIQDWQAGVGGGNTSPALRTIVTDTDGKVIIDDKIQLPNLQDPQKMGSAITYYRRYALQSLFLLQAQDDDAEGAKTTIQKKTLKAYEEINKVAKENGEDPF